MPEKLVDTVKYCSGQRGCWTKGVKVGPPDIKFLSTKLLLAKAGGGGARE